MLPDLRATIADLGLTQTGAARLVGVDPRTMRRWVADPTSVPGPVWRLFGVMDLDAVRQRLIAAMEH